MEMLVRILTIVFVALSPYVMILLHGPVKSLSQYWETPFQPMFIFANAATSYFFFSTSNWRIPSLLLMLLTAFSVEAYPGIHNALAIGFFIACAIPLYRAHHFRYYLYLYLITAVIVPVNLLVGEVSMIMILCAYHIQLILYKHILINRRKNSN